MPAAIYARYSSENQRPESIDDQSQRVASSRSSSRSRFQTTRSTATRRSPALAPTGRRSPPFLRRLTPRNSMWSWWTTFHASRGTTT